MLTAYAAPVPSEDEKVNAPLFAVVRSSVPLSRKTNVPVSPDTVPPILTVTGGGGGGVCPGSEEPAPPQPPSAATLAASNAIRRIIAKFMGGLLCFRWALSDSYGRWLRNRTSAPDP